MARATLKQVKARKDYPCVGGDTINAGDLYWSLTSFRQQARYCSEHKPSVETVDNFAPKSSADRASSAASQFSDAASELNEIASEVQSILQGCEDEKLSEEAKAQLAELKTRVEAIGVDTNELESLTEEMTSWRDNMGGSGLENTSKFQEVSDCADTLEGVDTDVSIPEFPSEMTYQAFEEFADECESQASELETAASDIEGVDFPGMF